MKSNIRFKALTVSLVFVIFIILMLSSEVSVKRGEQFDKESIKNYSLSKEVTVNQIYQDGSFGFNMYGKQYEVGFDNLEITDYKNAKKTMEKYVNSTDGKFVIYYNNKLDMINKNYAFVVPVGNKKMATTNSINYLLLHKDYAVERIDK